MADSDILSILTKALDKFNSSIEKDVAEVRKQKEEVMAVRNTMFNEVQNGQYVRNESALILSAPRIIIGNVDQNGNLMGGSEIVIRGNTLSLEATGTPETGGSITSRAASIRHIAVDPGIDGKENIVCTNRSEVVSQANSIVLDSSTDKGSFVSHAGDTIGICLQSETGITLNATPSVKNKSAQIDAEKTALESNITALKSSIQNQRSKIDTLLKSLQDTVKKQFEHNDNELILSMDHADLLELKEVFTTQRLVLAEAISMYVDTVANLAEQCRRKKALDNIKTELSKIKDFEKNPIGANITMNTEAVRITAIDGDGNLRDNAAAGLSIRAPHMSIDSTDYKGATMKDSSVSISTQDISLKTVNAKLDDKKTKGDIPATGSVMITSKNIIVQAVDNELMDGKIQEKALTKDGTFALRVENVLVSNTATDGKATGKIDLNAKDIRIAAYDLDKEKRTDKEMAKGSQVQVLTEKVFIGSNKAKKAVELVQVAAKQVGIMGKETAEMQEGEAKSVLTLSGGNVTAGGSAVELKGNTTIEGNADIKGEAKAPKVTSDQVEAKSAFKSPNINDTMGAGVPGSPGKPSAKLKEAEGKAAEKK